jgi:hypothetical protein
MVCSLVVVVVVVNFPSATLVPSIHTYIYLFIYFILQMDDNHHHHHHHHFCDTRMTDMVVGNHKSSSIKKSKALVQQSSKLQLESSV